MKFQSINLICLVIVLMLQLSKISEACKPLWDNSCTGDNECCSRNCFKENGWKFGVCKQGGIPAFLHKFGQAVRQNAGCKSLWDNTCVNGNDCCSRNCDRPGNWKFGVCKP